MLLNFFHHCFSGQALYRIISLTLTVLLAQTTQLQAQDTISLNLGNYLPFNQTLPFMGLTEDKPAKDDFSLTNYYDELEPPYQDGRLGRYSVLGEDTLYFMFPAVCIMAVLYSMPESTTNWDREEINWENGKDNWKDNVVDWTWDEDEFWINYLGHPYFGSGYFIHARHYGFSRLESLTFAFTTSAFYEFCIEGWAEPVSIQDLIFTPLLGWGVAELLLPLEHHIHKNNDKVLYSKILGGVSLFLIDPFGHIIRPLKKWSKIFFSDDAQFQLSPTIEQRYQKDSFGRATAYDQTYGFRLNVRW